MERKYIIYESNIKVDVVEAKADASMEVEMDILEKYELLNGVG